MRLGFTLPQYGALAQEPGGIEKFARRAEDLGADSLWVGDRLFAAVRPVVGYAGTDSIPTAFRTLLDPLGLLTVAATVTRRVRLGSDVLVLPWYPPVLLARQLTTIDHLSGGRLIPGFGSGWSPDEFRAVGVPWEERGARLDEGLDVLEKMWTDNPVEHAGDAWSVPAAHVELKPAQRPRPPIYLAGMMPPALRRVGRRADGWLPAGAVPGRFQPAMFAERLAVVRRSAQQAGRDADRIDVIVRANVLPGTPLQTVADELRVVEEEVGIDKAFVDLLYLAGDADEAADVAGRLLDLVRAG